MISKTSLLRSFVNKKFDHAWKPQKIPYSVVNSVETGGIENSLVMQEFDSTMDYEVINNPSMMEACDVVLLVFDSSDSNSFQYIADIAIQIRAKKTRIVIASAKTDAHLVAQVRVNYVACIIGICLNFLISSKRTTPRLRWSFARHTIYHPQFKCRLRKLGRMNYMSLLSARQLIREFYLRYHFNPFLC